MRVSHETIYRTLFVQARGALRKELTACCAPSARSVALTSGPSTPAPGGSGTWCASAEIGPAKPRRYRAIPGHWEGSLLMGKGGKSAIGTLVGGNRVGMWCSCPCPTDGPRRTCAQPSRDSSFVCLRSCVGRSRGIKARRSPKAPCASPSIRTSTSTSATPIAHGSAAATRTPTGCYAIIPEDRGPQRLHARRPRRRGEATEHASPTDLSVEEACRSILSYCCVDWLRPPWQGDHQSWMVISQQDSSRALV